ncbi:MAG: DUF1343 domain-containing protein [Pyrinomonadaceae bacterium]|nr:DUF1343 domain-containing protein [Pyrinomonadaceae bacterium]
MRKHSVVSSQQSVVGMGSRYRVLFILCALCVFCGESFSQALPVAAPQAVGMNAAKLNGIDALVEADIAAKKLPGAVVLVGHKGKIVFRKAYGNRSLVPTVEKMTVDTIFDLASLTKPIATATSIMILVEQGKLRLNDTIGMYIPDIDDAAAKRVTIQQLLTHTSGYRPDFDLGEKWTGREGMLAALKKEKLRAAPGTKFVYSDIGFIVLGEIFQRLGGSSVGDVAYLGIKGLQLQNTFFSLLDPGSSDPYRFTSFADSITPVHLTKKIAPSENIRGQNSYLGSRFDGGAAVGDKVLRGAVHDPTSYRMGGVAGHAGLFSTADDLARYCQMLLNGGTLDGKRVLSAKTISRMTAPIVVSESGDARGLGWDMNTSFSSNRGDLFPLGSFGHTGFTGTSVWIDRVSHTFVVFLSNRVHPDGKGDVGPLRAKVATVVASAIEDTPIEKFKQAEAEFNAAVAAQVPRFREVVAAANRVAAPTSAASSVAAGAAAFPAKSVLNGIDVLERNGFKEFEGMKIGLVTNHTGRNLAGKQTIDILNEAKNVKLTAMFAPEHGIRGELDTEKIDDTKDEKTGLPVYSLYKDGMRRPKPEQTATIDAFVYDIQDIGARFYTYTATLKNVMEEAAKAGKPVFVLDRPNPINGNSVEGSLADEDKLNFIAPHTVPVRYGMTIGEYAQLINAERKIGADLRVIKMDGWSRSMWFDETGQTWVNPSPNMRSLTQATLYPGIGLLETTNVSVGRGTDTPFEVVGAPWLDGQKLAAHLNSQNIAGVRFIPVRFKPNASVFKDEQVAGINIVITDRKVFNSFKTGIEIAVGLRKLYPNDWLVDRYARLLVNADILAAVKRGDTAADIEKLVSPKITEFNARRASYLLYKR